MKREAKLVGGATGLAMATMAFVGVVGCAAVLPTHLEKKVTSNGSADDHMAAALVYQSEAQRLVAEAARYDAAASKIGPYEDSKGLRRGGLVTAAQVKRNAAGRMQELYAAHFEKAQAMYGMKKPE